MKVFISWSGEFSHTLASEFRVWLPGALQMVRPYFTPSDIEKGSKWSSEISRELEESDVGVLFVTRENINSSWLAYEAGALSKRLDRSRVCPLIFQLSPEDLPGPLRQFQATQLQQDDFRTLLGTINSAAGEAKLNDKVLDQVFEMWWPKLRDKFQHIVENYQLDKTQTPLRAERDILEEILSTVRFSAERSSRSTEIAPRAIEDLVRSLIEANDAVQGVIDKTALLNALKKMVRPIEYILTRGYNREDESWVEMIKALRALSFEYPRAVEEDDIPF